MVSTIPGSEILTSTLNMISQSLQIPVIIFLVVFAIILLLFNKRIKYNIINI